MSISIASPSAVSVKVTQGRMRSTIPSAGIPEEGSVPVVMPPRAGVDVGPRAGEMSLADKKRQRRLAEIKQGKANLKKLEELARSHWADHSTRMPEPIPHKRMRLKPLKIGIPCEFHETHFDQWEPTIISQPIVQPPGGRGPMGLSSSMEEHGRTTAMGSVAPGFESRLSHPYSLATATGGGTATHNLDPKFYESTPRDLVQPFMSTGPIMSKARQFWPAKPAQHTHGLTEVHRRPSLINRDLDIRKKRPLLTQTNMISSSFGTLEVMKQTLPELVETEPEKAVLPEVRAFDPATLQKETTMLLLNRVDKMLNVKNQVVKDIEVNSVESVKGETPNLLDLRSDFSEDEYLPEVIPRLWQFVGTDAKADMLKAQGEVTGIYRPSNINVRLKCYEWLKRYTTDKVEKIVETIIE